MAFSEFCDDLAREEVPVNFEGGNDKQRAHLNKLVKTLQAILDSAKRRGGEGDGALPGNTVLIRINDGGEAKTYRFVAELVAE